MVLTAEEEQKILKLLSIPCKDKPPSIFNYQTKSWKRWKRKFHWFIHALEDICSELQELDKIHLLMYLLGDYAKEIFLILQRTGWHLEMPLEEVMYKLNEHFRLVQRAEEGRNDIYVRLNFHRRMQFQGESVTDFVKAVKFLAQPCNFGESYEMILRDKIVIGIICDSAREKMFSYDDMLTFDAAVKIAYNHELRQARPHGL